MEWWQQIPVSIWQLPAQMLIIVLLSLGIFVTKREHSNMTKMMEYFRTIAENKEETILNQAKAIEVLGREISPLLKETLNGVRQAAQEKGKGDV